MAGAIKHIDPHYSFASSTKTILSICCKTDGFSFTLHSEKGVLCAFSHEAYQVSEQELAEKAKACIAAEPLLHMPYLKVLILLSPAIQSLQPRSLYDEWFHQALCGESPTMEYLSSTLPDGQTFLSGLMPKDLLTYFRSHFHQPCFVLTGYPVILNALSFNAVLEKKVCDALFLDIQNQAILVVVQREGEIIFFNSFLSNDIKTTMLHLNHVCEACDLKTKRLILALSGNVSSKLFKSVKRVFPASFINEAAQLQRFLDDDDFFATPFSDLLSLPQCVL